VCFYLNKIGAKLWAIAFAAVALFSVACSAAENKNDDKKPSDSVAGVDVVLKLSPPGEGKTHKPLTYFADPSPLAKDAVVEDWTDLLGPRRNGFSKEKPLLKSWPKAGPTKIWEMITGTGYTSPCIIGNRLIYLQRVADEEVVQCLRADNGRLLWEHKYPSDYRDRIGYNNGPRSSPVYDRGRIYTLGALGQLRCLELISGKVIWQRDLTAEYKIKQGFFGVGSTPLIEGDKLIVNVGAPGGPTVVAFDLATGKVIWSSGKQWGASYASPMPAIVHGKRRVMVFAGGDRKPPTGGLISLDPATGKIDFEVPWRSKTYTSVNAANPVILGNRVFVSATYETGGLMVEIDEDFKPKTAWTSKEFGTHFGTSLYMDGHLYGFDGRNPPLIELVCFKADVGKEVWREKLEWKETVNGRPSMMSPFRASMIHADGAVLCVGEYGHLLWLELTPKGPKILARHWMFAAMEGWTPPVVSRGLLYICQNEKDQTNGKSSRLICYDLRGK
jgi:outer membrane protein assembly factor BamB